MADWQTWLTDLGLHVPNSPDMSSVILACVLVAGSFGIGWLIGVRLSPPLTQRIYAWAGRTENVDTSFVSAFLQYGVMALVLVVAGNATQLSPIALLIVGLGLGVAVAMLVRKIVRAFGLGRPIAWIIAGIVFVATLSGTLGGMQPLIQGLDSVGFTVGKTHLSLLSVVNFIVVAALLFVGARIVNRVLMHTIGRMHRLDVSQRALVQKLAGMAVVVVAILLGIDVLGIDLTALTVFSGAFGLAVGFGLQKTFGNLISGLILLMDRSVKPGDVIVVGDTFGQVSKIGVRAVSVVTRDGKEHLIPNEQLMTDPVENWSYSSRNVRVHIPIGVGYSSDLALAQRLMVEAADASKRVLPTPKPSVWLKGFGDNSVDHEILVWIADPEAGVGNVRSEILNKLWLLFKENDIEIPFPQRDVHIKSLPQPPEPAPQ